MGLMTPAIGPTASRWWHGSSVMPSPFSSLASASSAVSASPSKSIAPISAPLSGPEARANSMGGPACRNVPFSRPSASPAGRTSTKSAPPRPPCARTPAGWPPRRRGSARTAARSRSVPCSGGCHAVSVTGTACARIDSANRATPAVAIVRSAVSRPFSSPERPPPRTFSRMPYAAELAPDTGAAGAWPRMETACLVAAALDRKTEAPASRRAVALRLSPCGSPGVPLMDTMTGSVRPSASAAARAARIASASSGAGSGCAPWPSTRSRSRTPHVASAASAAMRSSRSDGSIIGCARPWVIESSPKSMTTCPGSRRSGPRARSGRSGVLDRMSPRVSPATSIASSASVPPQKSPLSDDPVAAGCSASQCGHSTSLPASPRAETTDAVRSGSRPRAWPSGPACRAQRHTTRCRTAPQRQEAWRRR